MITLDRGICQDREQATTREWLVTNGLGGYACGSLAMPTRRYHALLVAALQPPADRRVCLARLAEQLTWGGGDAGLDCQEYADGTVTPTGYQYLQTFALDHGLPLWRYAIGDVVLERRLWMPHGYNATAIEYHLAAAPGDVTLTLTPLVAWRDQHTLQQGDTPFDAHQTADGVDVIFDGALRLALLAAEASFAPDADWHRDFQLPADAARGYTATEDLYRPGRFTITLAPGARVLFRAALVQRPEELDHVPWSLDSEQQRRMGLLRQAGTREDTASGQLALAADQFLVRRGADGATVIAGYPWFGDWGRDTMIALPGLTLATHRFAEARAILSTWSRSLCDGLLPNQFAEHGEAPDYRCADAALWLVDAAASYVRATGDRALQEELYPSLAQVITRFQEGTAYGIGVDPTDGLLRAELPGHALTWMDAKVGDRLVTPRQGKPVELSALWYHALCTLAGWAIQLGQPALSFVTAAERCAASFNDRFWYADGAYLYDLVDGAAGDDPALRPNQLFAIALYHPVLWPERWRDVVAAAGRSLLTPVGLRTLSPNDPAYRGVYAGDVAARDVAYHRGTVWPWLLGPYLDAYLATHHDIAPARALLQPLLAHLPEAGIGSIAEVFDGDLPHRPNGCIAQAWSVAELLRLWRRVGGD